MRNGRLLRTLMLFLLALGAASLSADLAAQAEQMAELRSALPALTVRGQGQGRSAPAASPPRGAAAGAGSASTDALLRASPGGALGSAPAPAPPVTTFSSERSETTARGAHSTAMDMILGH